MSRPTVDWVIVGLRNPADYAGTRHNLGAEVVAALAGRHDFSLSAARSGSGRRWVRERSGRFRPRSFFRFPI